MAELKSENKELASQVRSPREPLSPSSSNRELRSGLADFLRTRRASPHPSSGIRSASQMPDTAWQKHLANMSDADLQTAKDAVELHKAQQAAEKEAAAYKAAMREQGLLDDEEEGGEEDEHESLLDKIITRVSAGLLVGLGVLLAAMYLHDMFGDGTQRSKWFE